MPQVTINAVGIAIVCVFVAIVITLSFLPLMTKASSYTPPPKRGSWTPPYSPGTLPNIKPSNPRVCLPGTLGYAGLVTCTRQTDCNACTDSGKNTDALECVTINNTNNQLVNPTTKQLDPPVNIHLYRKGNGVCSGRGIQKTCDDPNAPANCQSYWCDCGSQYASANNDPTNCDIQLLQVTEPGSYCLPSYVNACNPYTSETVLSNTGKGSQWLCQCKYPDLGLFVQNSEGTDCTVPIACGSQEPQLNNGTIVKVLSYQNNDPSCTTPPGSNSSSDWKLCNSFPNYLVSSDVTQNESCMVPTEKTTVKLDDTHSYDMYTVSKLADPTCSVLQFNNTCTVQVAYNTSAPLATQVLRGSGNPDDPILQRVWPPFPELLPIGMQRCPNGWTGDGTVENPCTDSNQKFSFSYLDKYGQWNGKFLSLQDLRNVGYNPNGNKEQDAVPCSTPSDCSAGFACTPAGICAPLCPCPEGFSCVNGVCSKVTDPSCPSAVGIPNTLGAIEWNTVNSACSLAPPCLESAVTLQQVQRSLKNTSNIFPFDATYSNTSCSATVQAPSCTCPIALTPCTKPGPCGSTNSGTCSIQAVSPSVTCTQDSQCAAGQFCNIDTGVCSIGTCQCTPDGAGFQCVDPPATAQCTAVEGSKRRPYDGNLDGPIVDDNNEPLGGACSCNGYQLDVNGNRIPLVPAASLPGTAGEEFMLKWDCVPDPCYVSGSSSAFDPTINQCHCTADSYGRTYYSWNTNNGLPTCQRDPCNPSGTTSTMQVACQTSGDCLKSICYAADADQSNKKCYIFTDQTCSANGGIAQCASVQGVNEEKTVKCLEAADGNFYCAVQDLSRPSCGETSDCSLGVCNPDTKLCTGGCICTGETDAYFTDANPLHSACSNPCLFDPCGSNGVCSVNEDGSYKCTCNFGFSGDSCENRVCKPTDANCSGDSECCNGKCTFDFWYMRTVCQ